MKNTCHILIVDCPAARLMEELELKKKKCCKKYKRGKRCKKCPKRAAAFDVDGGLC